MTAPPFDPPFYTSLIRGGITVTGDDAASFLQGLITNDITLIPALPVLYAAHLTPQGKFLHDFFTYPVDNGFLIETEAAERRDDLAERLTRFRLRAKVTITPVDLNVIAGTGPCPAFSPSVLCAPDPRHAQMGWRAVQKGTQAIHPPAGYTSVPFDHWDAHRIALCLPDGSRDAEIGISTPEELHLPRLNAVSFTKGCYIGQELTARMAYRGLGKRHLYILHLKNSPGTQARTEIAHEDQIVGTLRSSCGFVALGLLRDDTVQKIASDPLSIEYHDALWHLS